MIRPVHVHCGLEVRLPVGEPNAMVQAQALEARNVAVVRAVEDQIIHVLDGHIPARGKVLAVDRSNRDDRTNSKVEIEFDRRVVRIAIECIERRGVPHRLTPAGMAHQRDAVQIDFAKERIVLIAIEVAPCLEMLEQQPSSRIVLLTYAPIHKVFVHGGQNHSPAGEQLPQITVPRIREVTHVVVPMHDQH